jgi:hypothetical protein
MADDSWSTDEMGAAAEYAAAKEGHAALTKELETHLMGENHQ